MSMLPSDGPHAPNKGQKENSEDNSCVIKPPSLYELWSCFLPVGQLRWPGVCFRSASLNVAVSFVLKSKGHDCSASVISGLHPIFIATITSSALPV